MDTILWYAQITWDYVMQMLPCAALGALGFICLRPWRKKRLAERGLRSGRGREAIILLFILFSAGLSALTIFPSGFWSVNGVLYYIKDFELNIGLFYWDVTIFKELAEYVVNSRFGAWTFYMLLGNIIMFMPFGFCPALVGDKPRWWKALLTGFCVSTFIEIVQLFVGRSGDINDIILNTFGAFCGYWVYLLLKRLAPKFIARFKLHKTEVSHGCETRN